MTDAVSRWQTINAILAQALELPAGQREGHVRDACGADAALADEVLELLDLDGEAATIRYEVASAIGEMAREKMQHPGQVGLQVGPFVITREIARGGMGQVFEAHRADDDFDQKVAIKLLPGHRLNDEARMRFALERRVLAGLQHPNIAQLIDGGTLDDGLPYIVMEYVDGVSIDRYCQEQKLSNEAIIKLVLQVCAAVQHAHSSLVVHRDIKPANILVDASGTPKLLDFGIAKLMDEHGEPLDDGTRAGLRLLTPAYASPEQVEGGKITTAVDVYALGLLTYILLTDRLPYRSSPADRTSLEQQILHDPPEAPSDALLSRDGLSKSDHPEDWPRHQHKALKGDLDTILLTALRKEPERRYGNVAAFMRDLQRHLAHRPIQARPETLGYRLALMLKRHPVAAPATVAALVLALTAGGVFTWLLAEERDQAIAAEQRAVRTAEFAASLLSDTSAQEGGERLMRVSDLLENAGKRIDAELPDEPLIALPMHLALGEAHMSWGEYELGFAQASSALELARSNKLLREEAFALELLSRISHDLGDVDEALSLSEASLDIIRQVGTQEERARALNSLALSLNEAGRREQALPVFREAEVALRALHDGDHADLAWLINNHGWCLHALNRYAEAGERYDAALAMLARLDNPPFDQALTLSNRAGLMLDLGKPGAAVEDWRKALTILQGMFGEEGHAGVARGHNLLAMGLRELGMLEEALEQNDLAVAMNLRLLGDEHRWTGYSLSGRANTLLELGKFDEAEVSTDAAAAIIEALHGADHIDFANIHLLRGRAALSRGEIALAETELRAGAALVAESADNERTALDTIEWYLAYVLAMQRLPEGRTLAMSARDRLASRVGPADWRVRLRDASLRLVPFSSAPQPDDLRWAEDLVIELSGQIGSDAPRITALAQQVRQSR